MRSPMARFYEHLQEVRSVKRAASYAKYLKKAVAFKNTHLGDLCVWVVAVAQLPMIRALEHCFLRIGHWPANSQSTKAPSCAPQKHSRASRRCARRPPPRFRFGTAWSSEQHLLLVTRLASTFVSRQRQTADIAAGTRYLSQAFGMRFDAAYWHVCKHRLALTGQGGPLDLRAQQCRPLLACYLSREKHVCWTSHCRRVSAA